MKIRSFSEPEVERLAAEFGTAEPYPHVVIDDFLVGDPSEALRFPAPDWAGWRRYEGSEYQPEKMICDDIERIPDEFARLIRQMCDPSFLRLLEQWGEKTGTPVLVNTSFNGFHEPLVCSPRDAIRVFYGTGLDILALEDFVLRK